jgi:hypothetical protein
MMTKVENYCISKRTRSICVDADVKACINCMWYEQYFRQNRGNIRTWVPTCSGYCLLQGKQRGPLSQPCKDFETE